MMGLAIALNAGQEWIATAAPQAQILIARPRSTIRLLSLVKEQEESVTLQNTGLHILNVTLLVPELLLGSASNSGGM